MSEFKAGMFVKSEKKNVTGIIAEVGDCYKPDCGKEYLTLKGGSAGVIIEYHTDSFEQLQRVWLCLSDAGHSGYFLWEIIEEVGNPENNNAPHGVFTECRDGSRVLIQCYHFFEKELAQKHIDSCGNMEFLPQYAIRIGE